jgi:hypothetical protein
VGYLVIVGVFVLLLPLSTPRIYATDEVQYYAYVRSLSFDGDLDFRNEYEHFARLGEQHGDLSVYHALLRERQDADTPLNPQTGKYRNLAPIGSSLMWSPGFVLADVGVRLARLAGAAVPADGYSRPYIWAVCGMSALYALLGLLLTYRLVRRLVGVGVFAATLATVGVWLSTPLVFYTFIAMPWSHATAFFLFALFLTLWLQDWNVPLVERLARRRWWRWALLGVVGGLMTMTREQLGLLLIMPAVEGLAAYGRVVFPSAHSSSEPLRTRILRVPGILGGHGVFLLSFALTLVPQLLTYQVLNGRPFPATVVAGKLKASGGISPHFFDTLFHPRHGAFVWSPVLFIGLVGLFFLLRRDWFLGALLGLGFLAQTYINGSFGTTWHLSGSFGFRRLIECTPIFVVGLAVLLDYARVHIGRGPLLAGVLFFIYWNGGLMAQWAIVRPDEIRAGLVWDGMLYYQFVEVPIQVARKSSALLFDRSQFLTNRT